MSDAAVSVRRRTWPPAGDLAVYLAVGLLVCAAVVGPLLAPDSVYDSDILNTLQPPSVDHWLGTDDQGRDVFWRVIVGTQVSLLSSIAIVALYSAIGMTLATVAAIAPRWLDETLMRVTDIFQSLPGLVVALGIAAALGASLRSAIIALAVTGWPTTARILRGILRETMEKPFVAGAMVLGVSRWRLMTRHVLPNSLDVMIVKGATDIGNTVLVLSGLSFIGVGAQPPSAEWGAMIAGARTFVSSAWWAAVSPGVAVAFAAVSLGLLGDILQKRRDPLLRGS